MWRHLCHTNASARDRVLRRTRPPAPPVHQCWLRGGVRGLAKFPRRNGPAGRRGCHPPSLGNIGPRGFEGGVWTPGSRCVWHARTCEISSVNSLAHAASCEISAVNSLARRRKCVDGPIVWPARTIVCGVPSMGTWRRAACRRRGAGAAHSHRGCRGRVLRSSRALPWASVRTRRVETGGLNLRNFFRQQY